MKSIAIIPAFNEEKTIEKVVRETRKYVNEVIVINDGSSDKTEKNAKKGGATVVSLPKNRGFGYAVRRGIQEAIKRGAEIIVQLDGDGQHLPKEIPKLIKPIRRNEADAVIGSRFLDGSKIGGMPFVKRFGNRVFNLLIKIFTGLRITDGQTGFRAFKKEVVESINLESAYSCSQETIIKIAKEGWRLKEVPITVRKRKDGSSKIVSSIFTYTKNQLITMIRVLRDYHPLGLFGIGGALMISFGFFLGLWLFWRISIVQDIQDIDILPSIILVALLMISGIQLTIFALITDMLKSMKSRL